MKQDKVMKKKLKLQPEETLAKRVKLILGKTKNKKESDDTT